MRSFLFIPADSPKKLDKGMTSGADALLLDLEDSISPANKDAARHGALDFLKANHAKKHRPKLIVRVNGFDTGLTDDDLNVIVAGHPDAILFPKSNSGADVTHLDAKLTAREHIHGVPEYSIKIIALATETAKAMFACGTYAESSLRLIGLTWGAEDLSAELGAEANRDERGEFLEPYRLARSLCLAGAAAARVQAIDTVYVDFKNEKGFRRECEEARRDGFTAKMAIHPNQVAVINEVFTPSKEQIARAQAIVDAFRREPNAGVVGIDGKMYDRPHLAKAEALLARVRG